MVDISEFVDLSLHNCFHSRGEFGFCKNFLITALTITAHVSLNKFNLNVNVKSPSEFSDNGLCP